MSAHLRNLEHTSRTFYISIHLTFTPELPVEMLNHLNKCIPLKYLVNLIFMDDCEPETVPGQKWEDWLGWRG